MDWYLIIIGLVFAYFAGTPVSHIVASAKGIDLSLIGSGNAGATNLARPLGKIWGVAVFLLDVAKAPAVLLGLVPLVIWLSGAQKETAELLPFIFAAAAILGNLFPALFGFHGGKAVATSLGVILALNWQIGIGGFAIFMIVLIVSNYISLGSLFGAFSALAFSLIFRESFPFIASTVAVFAIVLVRHTENIRKLWKGKEEKFFKKSPH